MIYLDCQGLILAMWGIQNIRYNLESFSCGWKLCLAINRESPWLLCECSLKLDSRWPMPRLLGIPLKSLQPGCLLSLTLSQVSTCAVLACWPVIIPDRRLVRDVPLRAGRMTAARFWMVQMLTKGFRSLGRQGRNFQEKKISWKQQETHQTKQGQYSSGLHVPNYRL